MKLHKILVTTAVAMCLAAPVFAQNQNMTREGREKPGKEEMQQKQERIRQRLQQLKQTDPEKYQQVMHQLRGRLDRRLSRLKTENPEKYRQIMQKRKQFQALRKMRREDPEKFRQYLQNHPEMRERLQQFRGKHQGRQGQQENRGRNKRA